MVPVKLIEQEIDNTLSTISLTGMGEHQTGKVRDSFRQDGRRIIVVSDRISAFDCVLGTIPFKGQVLNQTAAFWFEKTRDVVPNHVIAIPDPNVMVVHECEQLPLEFIVRGYMTGVTKTSAWYNYSRGVRDFCGNILPEGLAKDQKFERPILTPTTKLEKHDRPISREQAISEGLIDAGTFDEAAEMCFRLFDAGVKHAESRGLILVDTKYEIGRLNGRLVVTDEIHTPDSSRYWFTDTYDELFKSGKDQRKLDKEYVREWLAARGFTGEGTPPELPAEVKIEAAQRYISAYEIITGMTFQPATGNVAERIARALEPFATA